MRKFLILTVAGLATLATLTGCTQAQDGTTQQPTATVTAPAPTVTITAPAPTVTATTPGRAASPGSSAAAQAQLLPTDADIADLAYRSGMPDATFVQFTVPASGYEILYVCYPSKLGDATGAAGYKDSNAGGSHNSATLTCDNKIHTLTADAAYVKKVGAVGKLTKLALTGDRMFVLGIDMAVRPLGR